MIAIARETQISAFISAETKEMLERYVRSTGVRKGHVIEEALRQHLQALREVPLDVMVSTRVVLTRESGERVLALLEQAPKATGALRKLLRGRRGR